MTKSSSESGKGTSNDEFREDGSQSEDSLAEVRASLAQKLLELEKRAAAAARHLSSLHSSDSAEQAQERENDDVLAAIKLESNQEIREVKKALQRIQEGEYGICLQCCNPISPQRLAALPYATLCIHCAQRDEKRG